MSESASVEVLSAEIRVLQVGSGQIRRESPGSAKSEEPVSGIHSEHAADVQGSACRS
jgi:hypothetical protein